MANKNTEMKMTEIVEKNDEIMELYQKYLKACQEAYGNIKGESWKLIAALAAIYSKKLYRLGGYKNIYMFAAKEFGIARGTCHSFIKIAERFANKDKSGEITGLKKGFEKYNISQLMFLTSIKDENLKDYKPNMIVQEMRELKKLKSSKLLGNNTDTDSTGSQEDSGIEVDPSIFDNAYNDCEDILCSMDTIEKKLKEARRKNPDARIRVLIEW